MCKQNKLLFSNIFSLGVLQIANYVLPLLTVPYLIRVIGIEKFGLLAFATSFVAFFNIITDYGFNLTATKQVSVNRNDEKKLEEIFSSVMVIKFLLMLLSFAIMLCIVLFIDKFSSDWLVYLFTFGTVVGGMVFPVWFFQGIEKMKYITYLNISSKTFFTVLIFVLVRSPEDYYFVPILTSLGFIIVGIYSLFLIKKDFGVSFKLQKKAVVIGYLKDGWHVFVSNIAISIYTISSTFILGLLTNNTVVGYFAGADKIIQAFKKMIAPITQALYPNISARVNKSGIEGLEFIRKLVKKIGIVTFGISVVVFVFSELIVKLLLGENSVESITPLRIMALLPFMVAMSNLFGIQTMLNFNRKKAFTTILVTGSILNLVLSFVFVPMFEHIGTAVSILIVESYITLAMFIYIQKSDLKLFGRIK